MPKKDDSQTKDDHKKDISLEDLEKKIRELKDEDIKEEPIAEAPAAIDEVAALKEALARALADLQNFRRRTEEDRGKFIKMANAELLSKLLPIVDNFHRSAAHLPENLKENDWVKGVLQIHDAFTTTLEKIGVRRVETVGQKLDPSRHEALLSGPGPKDEVTEEFEPGYSYQDAVIKPAKVKVGDGSAA